MGIRRRRKKVNTILSTIDRRLKSVELQRIPRVIKNGTITKKMLEKSIQIDLDASTDSAEDTPGTSTSKPPTFKDHPLTNIVEVRYKGYNEAGTANDRDEATIVFETDPGLNVGDKIRFAATVSALDVPSKTAEYKVESVGTTTINSQTYTTAVYRPGRATIVSGTRTYNKGWRIREANVTLPVDSFDGDLNKYKYWQITVYGKDTSPSTDSDYLYGPTWPAGVPTTSGIHMTGGTFDTGTLINIVGLGDPFDGTFKVINKTTVGTAITIKMEFKEYLASVTLPTGDGAIRAAAGRYLRDGETWTDTTVTPAVVWVWNEEKQLWQNSAELPDGTLVDDGLAPSAPTGLSGTSEGYQDALYRPLSRVSLSWTAPTTNSDGTNLSDLKGYNVYYRYNTSDPWTLYATDVTSTSYTVSNLISSTTVYFSVKAYDVTKNLSAYSQSFSITTVVGAITLATPSAPLATTKLGTVTIKWNGLDANGATPPAGSVQYVEVHMSTTSGFTPTSGTLKAKLIDKNDFYSEIDLAYDTNYYFKFVFIDAFGVQTAASSQTTVQVQPLVDTDLIAGSLTRWPFGEGVIDVNSLADGSISATQLASGAVTTAKIAAGAIGATEIAANAIVAGKIAANAVTATTIASLAVETGKLAANAITADKIDAGAVTAVKIAAGTITGDKISSTTQIELTRPSSTGSAKIGYQIAETSQDVAYTLWDTVYHPELDIPGSNPYVFEVVGWFGLWGAGAIELGNDFLNNYIDMYNDNTMNISSSGAGGINLNSIVSVNSTRFYSYGRIVGYSGSDTASVIIYDGYGGTEVFRVNTLNKRITVTGDIQYTGTITDISSERFKTNISSYDAGYSILDIPVVKYQYDFSKIDPLRSDIGDVLVGTIAERAVEVGASDIVKYDEEGLPHGVDYSMIGLLLVPIVKELKETVDELKKKVG